MKKLVFLYCAEICDFFIHAHAMFDRKVSDAKRADKCSMCYDCNIVACSGGSLN